MRRWQLLALAVVALLILTVGVTYLAYGPQRSSPLRPTTGVTPAPAIRPPALASLATDAPVPTPRALAAALAKPIRAAALGQVNAIVADAATGRVLFQRRPDTGSPPASTMKLLTSYAALHALPGDTTFDTSVVRAGRVLYLLGGGDMTLTVQTTTGYPAPSSLRELAGLVANATTSAPRGGFRLVYDGSGWRGPTLAKGWSKGYLDFDISRLSRLEVDEGRINPQESSRVTDPAAQAATAFAAELQRRGVQLHGSPAAGHAPAGAAAVARVSSPPLDELVQHMLTVSDNDLAEAIGRALAIRTHHPATFAGAAAAILAELRAGGIPTTGVRLNDASGLSRLDRVPPRTLVAVLRAIPADPRLAPIGEGLPVAGLTGTLDDRFRSHAETGAAGVTRAKTGTLTGVSALAGQVVDADGRLLDFVFLADHAPSTDPAESALDAVVTRLSRCGCTRRT